MKKDIRPTCALADAVRDMCERNGRTRGAVAGDVWLGDHFVLVTLKQPVIIDGTCQNVARPDDVVDLFDLMDAWQNGRR